MDPCWSLWSSLTLPQPVPCAACQSRSLDRGAAHATCCALGEATRGHNAVTALVHAAAQSCDCTAEAEVPGLIPGTDLSPADVLTSLHRTGHLDLLSAHPAGWVRQLVHRPRLLKVHLLNDPLRGVARTRTPSCNVGSSSGTSTQQAGGIDVNMKRDSRRKDVNMERPANG